MENRKKAGYLIWVMIFIGMLLVFPLKLVRKEAECASGGAVAYGVSENLAGETGAVQTFTAQYEYLQYFSLAFQVKEDSEKSGSIYVCLQDGESGKLLAEEEIPLSEVADCTYYDIPVGKWLKKGRSYLIRMQARDCGENIPALYDTVEESQHTQGNTGLTVNGRETAYQAVTRYAYETGVGFSMTICLWLFFICVGFAVTEWPEIRQAVSEKQMRRGE